MTAVDQRAAPYSAADADGPKLPRVVAHRRDGRTVVVPEPVCLGSGGRAALELVYLLRECQSHALPVSWDLATDDPLRRDPKSAHVRVALLHHLPPPKHSPDEPPELSAWRAAHEYGLFFHRQGPGFILAKDRRAAESAARFTLDHPDLLAAFHTCLTPTRTAELTARGQEAVSLLAGEGIVLISRGWAVTLPPRIRHWPVPYTGI
ncbi:DUF5825 family protein [Streptomyces sp. NPDC048106]|uniref:DUF5825 family protein n=1 Tax=Streptomyces sp. NPDC048106 TaxID=3155750 RepID=UPI003456719A